MKFFFGNLNLNLYLLHHTSIYTCKVTITQRILGNNNDTKKFQMNQIFLLNQNSKGEKVSWVGERIIGE